LAAQPLGVERYMMDYKRLPLTLRKTGGEVITYCCYAKSYIARRLEKAISVMFVLFSKCYHIIINNNQFVGNIKMSTLHKQDIPITRGCFKLGLIKSLITVLCLSAWSTLSVAQTCNSSITKIAPDNRYVINDDTVNDTETNLIWARCSQGQTYNNTTQGCDDSASTYNWQQALAQAKDSNLSSYTDWRLPNIKELASLVETACYIPSINASVFPNTVEDYYWSSSAYASSSLDAWLVSFSDGLADTSHKLNVKHVRLVRGGQ